MRRLLLVLALLVACSDAIEPPPPPPPPPPPVGAQYLLVDFFYEDVYPGNYHLVVDSLTGGTARLFFRAADGELVVADTVVVGEAKELLSGQTGKIAVLPKGAFAFMYVADSTGAVTFATAAPLWVFTTPTTLTDTVVTQAILVCYDDPAVCADRVVLEARWERVP